MAVPAVRRGLADAPARPSTTWKITLSWWI